MKKVFIDGKAGTTGLRIYERLEGRTDITLLLLSDEDRKDPAARKAMLNEADVAFLCLPDDAAREAVSFVENDHTVVIDTSTAHRTNPFFAYGFPELSPLFRERIASMKRIAVPGCHASGFIALVYPLIQSGLLSKDALLSAHSLTGYSGGGKKMIAEYEDKDCPVLYSAPRQYGLSQMHKHLPEMQAVTGLSEKPVFSPIVANFYSGMAVTVPLFRSMINGTPNDIREVYRELYNTKIVSYTDTLSEGGFYSAAGLSMKDRMEVTVEGNDDRILLLARYDNLGKGASGAALQCMNIVLGNDEAEGLIL